MPEYRRKVSSASLVLPLVRRIIPPSAFRHRSQSGTTGHGLIRKCPAMAAEVTSVHDYNLASLKLFCIA
jgi:hypothetical protein